MKLRTVVFALTLLGIAFGARAVEPQPVPVTISFVFCNSIFNPNTDFNPSISFARTDAAVNCPSMIVHSNLPFASTARLSPGPFSTVSFTEFSIALAAGETKLLSLAEFNFGEGRQVLHVLANILDARGSMVPGIQPFGYQPLMIGNSGVAAVSFEDAFLGKRKAFIDPSESPGIDLGGGYIDRSPISGFNFESHSVPAANAILPFINPDPLVMAKMPLGQLNRNIRVAGTSACASGTGRRGDDGRRCDDDDDKGGAHNDRDNHGGFSNHDQDKRSASATRGFTAMTATAGAQALPFGDPLIKGNMSMLFGDGTYHAAWGWVVRGWQQIFGIWIQTAWTYVGGDGSWQMNLPLPFSPVFVDYRPANRFVQLQDANGNVYAWGDQWNLTGDVTDIGYRAADFSKNGDLPNVDKLYVGATNVWVKFYNNGMNALRNTPIQVTFPNTLASGRCIYNTDSSGNTVAAYAWSCSYSGDGKIWIIPAHADNFVVQHEIGHSINSYYWNGVMAPGAGGAHSLTKCYNNGLALSEGFADFLAYWTQFDRTQVNPTATYANYNIETVNNGACNGPTNETWVSAAFWDLYDFWNDGPDVNSKYDSLYDVSPGAAVSIFLGNKRDGMPDYLPVVKSGQPTAVQNAFERSFRLNTIIP